MPQLNCNQLKKKEKKKIEAKIELKYVLKKIPETFHFQGGLRCLYSFEYPQVPFIFKSLSSIFFS